MGDMSKNKGELRVDDMNLGAGGDEGRHRQQDILEQVSGTCYGERYAAFNLFYQIVAFKLQSFFYT